MAWIKKELMLLKYDRNKKKRLYEDGEEARDGEIRFKDGTWKKIDLQEIENISTIFPQKKKSTIEIWIEEE